MFYINLRRRNIFLGILLEKFDPSYDCSIGKSFYLNLIYLDIQIYNVKPIPEPNPIFSGIEIPDKIARFYHVNEVRRFKFDRVVHKGLIDKDNEFKVCSKILFLHLFKNFF